MVRLCEALHVLPNSGSLFDQDAYLMFLFHVVLDADAEKQAIEKGKNDAQQARLNAQMQSRR